MSSSIAHLQEKHVETAKLLLGEGRALNRFVARILDDIANLKAMLQAISIGAQLWPDGPMPGCNGHDVVGSARRHHAGEGLLESWCSPLVARGGLHVSNNQSGTIVAMSKLQ